MTTVAELSAKIARLGHSATDYQLLDDHRPGYGHFLFRGPFRGGEVVWNCHLLPLLANPQPASTAVPSQYLDIPAAQDSSLAHDIHIGLNVLSIERTVILKTIIMVRQYKNLVYGRHQWK